jgi:hypothetical protein
MPLTKLCLCRQERPNYLLYPQSLQGNMQTKITNLLQGRVELGTLCNNQIREEEIRGQGN